MKTSKHYWDDLSAVKRSGGGGGEGEEGGGGGGERKEEEEDLGLVERPNLLGINHSKGLNEGVD